MAHVRKLGRTDRIDRAAVKLMPITDRGYDQTGINIFGYFCGCFKSTPSVEDFDRISIADAAWRGIEWIYQDELFALPFDFLLHIGVTGIQKSMALR